MLDWQKALGYSQPGDDEQLKDITARMSTNLLPYRDTNGFRKLLVALSASGTSLSMTLQPLLSLPRTKISKFPAFWRCLCEAIMALVSY